MVGEPGACPLVKLMLVPSSITTGSPLVYVPTNTCGSALLHTVTDPHSRCCELAYILEAHAATCRCPAVYKASTSATRVHHVRRRPAWGGGSQAK